jgi:hypothetical protein
MTVEALPTHRLVALSSETENGQDANSRAKAGGLVMSDQIRVWSFHGLCRWDRAFMSPIVKLDPLV